MNLYTLHSNPHELDFHDKADMHIPPAFHSKYRAKLNELDKRKNAVFKSAQMTLRWLTLRAHAQIEFIRIPEVEKILATDAYTACMYAQEFLHDKFPAGEEAISKNSYYALRYMREFKKGKPWPAAEHVLSSKSELAVEYAALSGQRFLRAEKMIVKDGSFSDIMNYVLNVTHGRFKEAESRILEHPMDTLDYWKFIWYTHKLSTDQWPEGEEVMCSNKNTGFKYCILARKRIAKVEKLLSPDQKKQYEDSFGIKL